MTWTMRRPLSRVGRTVPSSKFSITGIYPKCYPSFSGAVPSSKQSITGISSFFFKINSIQEPLNLALLRGQAKAKSKGKVAKLETQATLDYAGEDDGNDEEAEEHPHDDEVDDEDEYPPTIPEDMEDDEWGEGWDEEETWDPYEGCNSGFPGEGRGS